MCVCIPLCPQTGPPALAVTIPIGVLITTLICQADNTQQAGDPLPWTGLTLSPREAVTGARAHSLPPKAPRTCFQPHLQPCLPLYGPSPQPTNILKHPEKNFSTAPKCA